MKHGYRGSTLLAGLLATLLSAPAWAAGTAVEQQGSQPQRSEAGPGAAQIDAQRGDERQLDVAPGSTGDVQKQMAEQHPGIKGTRDTELFSKSAQELEGATVVDSTGAEIGTVKSIVSRRDSPHELHAVITPSETGEPAPEWRAEGTATPGATAPGPMAQGSTAEGAAVPGSTPPAAQAEGMLDEEITISLDELRWEDDKLHSTAIKADLESRLEAYEPEQYVEVTPADQPLNEFAAFEPVPKDGGRAGEPGAADAERTDEGQAPDAGRAGETMPGSRDAPATTR